MTERECSTSCITRALFKKRKKKILNEDKQPHKHQLLQKTSLPLSYVLKTPLNTRPDELYTAIKDHRCFFFTDHQHTHSASTFTCVCVCVGTVACELVVKLLIFHEMAEAHVSSHAVCTLSTTSLI